MRVITFSVLLCGLLSGSFGSSAAHPLYDDEESVPAALRQFVLKGYERLVLIQADLDEDGISDALLVLQKSGKHKRDAVRPLLLLIGDKDGSYHLAIRNDNIIRWGDSELEDPFSKIIAEKGSFTIEHSIWGGPSHWRHELTFTYNKKERNWFLHREHYLSLKFNPSKDPNAEALITNREYTKTEKQLGHKAFATYNYYSK